MKIKKTPRPGNVSGSDHSNHKNNLLLQNGGGATSNKGQTSKSGSRSSARRLLDFLSPVKISLLTMSFRIVHVLDRDNWWMVHPDEVYQSVEIGHIEAFGYGFRSYEFSPPEASANDTTRYQQLLLDANLAGLRSPIFPYFYTWVFFFASHLGITRNPYLISRVAHVSMTSLLPAAVYFYAKDLFKSRDAGIVAAIATASSVHLDIFGTRCFLQSFLAPVTFAALSLILRITNGSTGPFSDGKKEEDCGNQLSNGFICDNNRIIHKHKSSHDTDFKSTTPTSSRETSAEIKSHAESSAKLRHMVSEKDREGKGKRIILNGHAHSSSEQIDGFFVPCLHANIFTKECFAIGCFIGLASYVRPDVLLVHAVNVSILLPSSRRRLLFAQWPVIILGLLMTLSVGVLADRMYYQSWVISPYNWVKANVFLDFSTSIFGQMLPGFYVYKFISQDPLTSVICVVCVLSFLVRSVKRRQLLLLFHREIKDKGEENNDILLNQCPRLLLGCIVLLSIFSFHGHKEMRFIHDAIVFLQIFISGACYSIAQTTALETIRVKKEQTKLVFISALLLLHRVQHPGPGSNGAWVYQKSNDTHSINACLEFTSQQEDVRGIFLDTSLFMTGGMTLLHHDVPVLSLLLDGFFEFGFDSRLNSSSSNPLFPMKVKGWFSRPSRPVGDHDEIGDSLYSINSFTRSSNYVSFANAPAVVRIILENKNYNYLILRMDRRFLDIGFEEVFSAGNQKVLRRQLDGPSEMQLSRLSQRISVGTNATVLLHEGDVLANMGRCREAVDRFQACLTIQPGMIGAYFPLHRCLKKLGRGKEASTILATCFKMATKETCTTARPLTRIY